MKLGRPRTLKSAKYLQKRRKKTIFTIFLSVLGSILFITAVIFIFRLSFFQIKNIDIQGLETIGSGEITSIITQELTGSYFYSIPYASLLFYPKNHINVTILEKFKKINTIDTYLVDWNTLRLDISEKKPEVMVCDGFDDGANCYLVDQDAYVFDSAKEAKHFKYYVTNNATSTTIGSQFIPQARFDELQKLVHDISVAGIKVNGLLVGEDGSYELYVENMDATDAVVYFDDRNSFDKTASNLIVFWQNSIGKKIGLQTVPNFDYVNLRFGNNIFYLLKNESDKTQNKI